MGVTINTSASSGAHTHSGVYVPVEVDTEFAGQYGGYHNLGDVTGAVTVDWDNGNMQRMRLTGNVTFTFTNPTVGRRYLLLIEQDTVGSRTVTWPTLRWYGGAAPSLSTSVGAIDQIALNYTTTSAGSEYFAAASIGY